MNKPPISDDPYAIQLFDEIREALQLLFDHSSTTAGGLLSDYCAKYPMRDEDFYFHEGPFRMALYIQHEIFLKKQPKTLAFLEWSKPYQLAWEALGK